MLVSPEERLAYLNLVRIAPVRPLAAFVESFWYMQRDTTGQNAAHEFMHPGGGFGIVFDLRGGLSLDGVPITDPVFLDGTNTRSRTMGFADTVELVGIRFRPGGAYPLLGLPLAELTDTTGLLDALRPRPLLALHEQISAAPSVAEKIGLLQTWLLTRLQPTSEPLVLHSLNVLRERGGQIAIPDLAALLYISQRQLERLYHTQVGLTPKQYARLLRVEAARFALKQARGASLAHISAALDYYDQAHFAHEFKAVVGLSPRTYLQTHP